MQKKYKCLLFDLDGTLLDTAPQFLNCLNNVLAQNNLSSVTSEFVRNRVSDGVIRLIKDGFKIDEENPQFELLREKMYEEYSKNFLDSKPFAGVEELLKKLEKKRIDWMVVTNKPRKFTRDICQSLNWTVHAKGIISPEDADGQRKPDPATLKVALSKTKHKSSAVIYVGDNWRDIEAAKNCNIDSALALYGYIDKKDASLLKPTSKINQIEDLIKYI
jgi:phosphoglycolate phosphatase